MNEHCFAIPAYKDSAYLEECINSILQQTVPSDIIICTSTPTIQNKQLADKYQIPYFVNEGEGKGIASDWNFALQKASTPFVTIAHQDDTYDQNFTASVLAAVKNNTLIAFTNYADIHRSIIKTGTINNIVKTLLLFPFLIKHNISARFFKKMVLSFGDPICCPSVTIHKALIPDFTFSDTYSCVLDWEAWYRLAQEEGAFVFINQRLMKHRVHEASETSHQIKLGQRRKEEEAMLTKIWGRFVGKAIAKVYQLGQLENNI